MAVKLVGLPSAGATDTWTVDHVMWPVPRLEADPRLRKVTLNAGYLDYVGVFSVAEAEAMNGDYLSWDAPVEHWAAKNRELQSVLAERGRTTSMVVVRLYEWESGLE